MKYLINANGYFFAIEDEVFEKLDADKLKAGGCELPPNKAIMYESVITTSGQDLDEIESMEFLVKYDEWGEPVCVEQRGFIDRIRDSVEYLRGGLEEYFIDYVM